MLLNINKNLITNKHGERGVRSSEACFNQRGTLFAKPPNNCDEPPICPLELCFQNNIFLAFVKDKLFWKDKAEDGTIIIGLERVRIKGEVKDNKDYLNRIHEKSSMNLENSNKASKKKIKVISLQDREKLGEKIEKLIAESDLKATCCSLEAWQASFAKIKAYEGAEDFSAILRLVANPIRLKILFILLDRDWACNCEFEYAFNSHQTLISYHLRNLREGGLITYKKSGQWNFYRIRDEARPFLEQLRELVNLAPLEK